jgi:drug/metabolite transporter (DMT)-like permease
MVALAMLAFAANSLLCRFALRADLIDPASFTMIRLASGSITFLILGSLSKAEQDGDTKVPWTGAVCLALYAWAFAFAYVALEAGTGALLLFGAVQATMLGASLTLGERLNWRQGLGLVLSLAGLGIMLVPQFRLPSITQGGLMITAGIAWGFYSLIGRNSGAPMTAIRLSFRRAALLSVPLTLCFIGHLVVTSTGVFVALASGAAASGLGYYCWYQVLPKMTAFNAAIVQLTVPVIAAVFGALVFSESLGLRFICAALAIAIGVVLAALSGTSPKPAVRAN